MKHKALYVIFLLTVLAMIIITGSLEQERITCGQAVVASCVNFIAMAVSGYRSGMLTVPEERSHKNEAKTKRH